MLVPSCNPEHPMSWQIDSPDLGLTPEMDNLPGYGMVSMRKHRSKKTNLFHPLIGLIALPTGCLSFYSFQVVPLQDVRVLFL